MGGLFIFAVTHGQAAEFRQCGIASWYGSESGHRTADGEHFDGSSMTAAHRSLPFGTMVRVVDLRTGRSVVVRVNDRGPYAKGRIIDLSRAAARRLGMNGTARVCISGFGGRETVARDNGPPALRY
ncbi:MAG TPA: septal ring lytic transglycosylase RlpA family protein [Devosiaceae bacterium]|nr:septal ring lytic transglycosylase RlpA family protein [Devosiaceae bacterium]